MLESTAYLAFGFCAVGLAIVIVHQARKAFLVPPGSLQGLDQHPWDQNLVTGQFALCVGLLLGVALARNDAQEIGTVLILAGLFGFTVEFFGLQAALRLDACDRSRPAFVSGRDFWAPGLHHRIGVGVTIRLDEPYQQSSST